MAQGGKSRGSAASRGDGPTPPNELLDAALAFAHRGWPVFPCNTANKQPLLAASKDPKTGAKIKGTGGVSRASVHDEEIRTWWKRWPLAMVGLATGHAELFAEGTPGPVGRRLFVLDFDPRHDPETGEDFTLKRLKGEVEAQIGCALPATLAARTPSGGVHLYFAQPDDGGEPIRNRGNLPRHVDVRGLGGYVIAPPSFMEDGRRYRWLHGAADAAIAEAPAALIAELRSKAKKAPAPAQGATDKAAGDQPASSSPPSAGARGGSSDDPAEAAVRKYVLAAFDEECRLLAQAPIGDRNNQINARAFVLGQLVGAGALSESMVRAALQGVVGGFGADYEKCCESIDNGLEAGMASPRDLSDVAGRARERAARPQRASGAPAPSRRAPAPPDDDRGRQSSQGGARGRSGSAGRGAGDDQGPVLTRKCAFLPQTDLGNLERFLARHGDDFLYVEAWGWLAWDGRRWNRDMAVPLLGHAVQRTMRAIQDEAALIRDSGVPFPDPLGDVPLDEGLEGDLDLTPVEVKHEQQRRKAKSAAWYRQRLIARQVPDHGGERLDAIVQVKSNGEIVLLSQKVATWGRTSEGAGHIGCIAKLAEARLAARPDDFDADPLQLNVENGTLVFLRPEEGHGAAVALREHRREDRMTKIGGAAYDPAAACPKYDSFLARVQPVPEMRDFLDTWAGYNSLGLADAQKMALFYGEGSNGKGVWINTKAHILGDYAWAAGIETFIDQGKYRKGSDASPDLAALAGRRMVYANEPEDNSKFSDGLIKAMTSDEPIGGVRELMKPPFQLLVTFTNTVSANNMPKIGTDHGIQRRVQVVPWSVIVPDAEQDLRLKDKLKAEASGILNRMVRGALRYLSDGLAIPEAVKEATREYQQENDLLGRFLELCVERVEGQTVGATPLHRVFAAWQTWAGQLAASGKPWSAKYLNAQMKRKSFKIAKSSTMQWQDVALRYDEGDFVDHEGRPVERELPAPRSVAPAGAAATAGATSPSYPPGTPIPGWPEDEEDLP